MWSPYASNYDNPITYMDILGDEPEDADGCCKALRDLLISASGVVGGMINTLSFGAISSDSLNFRRKLDDEEAELFDNSNAVGKIGPVIAAFRSPSASEAPAFELAPVGPSGPIPVTLAPPRGLVVPGGVVNSSGSSEGN
ncbi:MAG TPA: hypothetical protein VGO47_06465, partial [Chlamydiales bacterium]|nr:hypothetical protein [Chlamydiales bacterium]